MKIKGSKLKFYLKILNLFLIINMIIGCFPRSLTIADAVINSDVANTRKASDTNADYLASATFYNYYSNYNLNSNYNNSINHNDEYYDKQYYSFETFNRKISDYAKENNMLYPLYFGDFWRAAGNNSNGTVSNPITGQPLLINGQATATNFYWALNRANRSSVGNDIKYDASVQGLVSEKLDTNGNITQDKEAILDLDNINTKDYNYDFNSITVDNGSMNKGIVSEKDGHSDVLKISLNNATPNVTKSFRIELPIISENFSDYNKYLTFDIYSELEGKGAPFIALKDKDSRQIAGWANGFTGDEYFDNELENGKWKTIVIDLEKLRENTNSSNGVWQPENFDFYNIVSLWIGHWSKGSIYIDNIKFSRDLSTKVVERVELPYFKETFVSENGEVVKGLEFPFKIRVKNDCNYYVFSSGKSGYKEDNSTVTDLVRINEKRTHLDYWFDVSDDDSNIVKDMNGVNGWGGSINEPGYFPFNKPEDGSKIENLNYGFGTKLEIPFTLTQDGQVKTINNNEKRDIQFNFKGDDDVWVYIDGNLVLDMGGAHSQTVGNINFKNRTATVDRVIKGSFRSHNLYQETGKSIKNFTLSNDSYINGDTSQGLVLCQYFGHKKSNFFMLHF